MMSTTNNSMVFGCAACGTAQLASKSIKRFSQIKTIEELQKAMIDCCLGKLMLPFYYHQLFNPLCAMSWSATTALSFAEMQCLGWITTYSQLELYDDTEKKFEKPCIVGLMRQKCAEQFVDRANASPDLVAFITRKSGAIVSLAISGDSKGNGSHYSWCNPCTTEDEAALFASWCPAIHSIVRKHQLVAVTIMSTNFMRRPGTMLQTVLCILREIIKREN